jgi:hypothetical protein
MRKRDDAVLVQVTSAEKKRFFRLARKRHTNLSEMIRQMLHQECDKLEAPTGEGKAA